MIARLIFIALLLMPADAFCAPKPDYENLQALPVVLKSKAVVRNDFIRLGDLFTGLDAKADKTVAAPAPALGKEAVLTADWLKKLALKNGLDWTPANSSVSVTVLRAADEIGKEEIRQTVLKSLKTQGVSADAEILWQKGEFPVLVPAGAPYQLDNRATEYNAGRQTFETTVVVTVDGEKFTEQAFSGKLRIYVAIPTAKYDLKSGRIITEDDIVLKNVLQEKRRNTAEKVKLEDLIGKELRRSVRAGQPVESTDVQNQVMVGKGKMITLNFVKGGIMLSVKAKALDNGGLGDVVRVMNMQSKSVVQGTVTGPETVSVMSVAK